MLVQPPHFCDTGAHARHVRWVTLSYATHAQPNAGDRQVLCEKIVKDVERVEVQVTVPVLVEKVVEVERIVEKLVTVTCYCYPSSAAYNFSVFNHFLCGAFISRVPVTDTLKSSSHFRPSPAAITLRRCQSRC